MHGDRRGETAVLPSLMQDDYQLTLQHLLQRARFVYSDSQVVTLTGGGLARAEFGEVAERVDRLSAALAALGVGQGDRVATLAWNTQRHLELYLSVPCTGAVLHTLNLRLSPEQLAYIVGHAGDRVVFVEDNLVGLLEPILGRLTTVGQWVVIGDGDTGSLDPVVRYDELLASADAATSTRRWTSGRPRHCATPAAPPAAPRAYYTRTARACCTRSARWAPTAWACPARTGRCRSCPCSTQTPGASRTRRCSPAPI